MSSPIVSKEVNTELYDKRVECPECGSLCYWSSHPPRELRCIGLGCGHIVAGEDGLRPDDILFKAGVDAPKREVVRDDING